MFLNQMPKILNSSRSSNPASTYKQFKANSEVSKSIVDVDIAELEEIVQSKTRGDLDSHLWQNVVELHASYNKMRHKVKLKEREVIEAEDTLRDLNLLSLNSEDNHGILHIKSSLCESEVSIECQIETLRIKCEEGLAAQKHYVQVEDRLQKETANIVAQLAAGKDCLIVKGKNYEAVVEMNHLALQSRESGKLKLSTIEQDIIDSKKRYDGEVQEKRKALKTMNEMNKRLQQRVQIKQDFAMAGDAADDLEQQLRSSTNSSRLAKQVEHQRLLHEIKRLETFKEYFQKICPISGSEFLDVVHKIECNSKLRDNLIMVYETNERNLPTQEFNCDNKLQNITNKILAIPSSGTNTLAIDADLLTELLKSEREKRRLHHLSTHISFLHTTIEYSAYLFSRILEHNKENLSIDNSDPCELKSQLLPINLLENAQNTFNKIGALTANTKVMNYQVNETKSSTQSVPCTSGNNAITSSYTLKNSDDINECNSKQGVSLISRNTNDYVLCRSEIKNISYNILENYGNSKLVEPSVAMTSSRLYRTDTKCSKAKADNIRFSLKYKSN